MLALCLTIGNLMIPGAVAGTPGMCQQLPRRTLPVKYVPPSVRETAFNCPHCGALAVQGWYSTFSAFRPRDKRLPIVLDSEQRDRLVRAQREAPDGPRQDAIDFFEEMAKGYPFLSDEQETHYGLRSLYNVSVSSCFNCKRIGVWIYDKMVYPQSGEATPPNPDLPEEVLQDYNEASRILDLSPRGSAALLRLAIQKLCKELGQSGKDLNSDIGSLVRLGCGWSGHSNSEGP